jgi:ketosteroid isomerase-like protein
VTGHIREKLNMRSYLIFVGSILTVLFSSYSSFSQTTSITFAVEMKGLGFRVVDTTLNVRIKGDIEPLNWTSGIQMKDNDNDGIYSVTIPFDSKIAKELTYKYVLNNVEWELGDNLKIVINPNNKPLPTKFRYNRRPGNPFRKFIGEWTLKDDNWEQGYNGKTDIVKIPNHFTICKEVNTDNSLLWVIEAPNSKGHIFWSFNSAEESVQWSSSFYSYRSGTGKGTVSENGDVTFKVSFEGEPSGSFGIYKYQWVSSNEFILSSVQYDDKGHPTGQTYGGNFIRITPSVKTSSTGLLQPNLTSYKEDIAKVGKALKVLDGSNVDSTLNVFSDDFVHMEQGKRAVTKKADLRKVLERGASYGETKMVHEALSVNSYHDVVLTRGRVKGTWTSPKGESFPFETNNIITFRRETDGQLKVWQVIFNRVTLDDYD